MKAAEVKARELAICTPISISLPGTSELPRDLVNMGKDVEKSSNTDQSKKCSTRKYAVGERPQEALTICFASTDNYNGELARLCEGDATKLSISKSAPHTAAYQTLGARCSLQSDGGMNLNDIAPGPEIQVKEIPVKDIEKNKNKLRLKENPNLAKLKKKNDNKLMRSRTEGSSVGPTTRFVPRNQKYASENGRMTPSSGSGHPMLGSTTTPFSPRQVIGSSRREDYIPSPSLVRSNSTEHVKSSSSASSLPKPKYVPLRPCVPRCRLSNHNYMA